MRIVRNSYYLINLVLIALLLTACGKNSVSNSFSEKPIPTPKQIPEPEKLLESLKTVDFDYIWEIRRKDGTQFSPDDKKFISERTFQVNRRLKSKDNMVIFLGSNFPIDERSLKDFNERFAVTDYSRSEKEIESRKKKSMQEPTSNNSNSVK